MKRAIASIVFIAGIAGFSEAVTLTSSTFETPFVTGDVTGQQGWQTELTTGTATVSTDHAFGGTQSLKETSSANDASFAWTNFSYSPATNANKVFLAETQVWLGPSTAQGAAGIDLYHSTATDVTEVTAAMIATDTGQLLIGGTDGVDTGFFSFTGGPTANFNAWNQVDLLIDYTTPSAPHYSAFLNGVGVDATASGLSLFSNESTLTDADLAVYGGATGDPDAVAYFDNYSVTTSTPAPEPATLAALGLGLVALVRRKKNR
jgi:hypothetical protein